MDIELVSQRDLDVAHEVSGIRFQYYSEEDIKRLSVRRITRERAFDDFGRPAPRGLYDPALGVLSYGDGACETCGSSYDVCPGHFGHIELPFPIVNPLLTKIVGRLLASSCWECGEMRISKPARDALLAELYFEDAGLPKCVHACEFFFSGAGTGSKEDKRLLGSSFATFFDSVPSQIKTHIRGVDIEDQDECSRAILTAAKLEWERAAKAGRLLPSPSAAWVRMLNGFERIKHGQCPSCGSKSVKVRAGKVGRIFRINSNKSETLLSPTEIDDQMQLLWASARKICELFYGHKGRIKDNPLQSLDYTVFFVRCVAVPPNRFRPSSKVGTMEVASEHPQNLCFSRILEGIAALVEENKEDFEQVTPQIENGEGDGRAELLEGEPSPTKKARNANEKKGWRKFKRTDVRRERDIAKAVTKIQDSLSYLYDNDPSERTVKLAGIRQQLEAKAGLFRQHMMGKRVNFSCRSVIGPDVFLGTDEIGIPQSFARLLTIPEPVTALNLDKMRQAVLNGPHKHPGATAVEYWTNSGVHKVTMLTQNNRHAQAKMLIQNNAKQKSSQTASTTGRGFGTSEEQTNPHNGNYAEMEARSSSILPRRVLRHVRNGDIVLFNRQPTLHRVSIMAHKVRVLPENRTIRFHYANCGSYNADFDGDEMNVHVPQDVLARTEAEELMLSSRHYIVPTSGSPIRGLIQDHVAGAALLSRRDMFLRKAKFCQLLFSATDCITSKPSYKGGRYRIPIPAILKPQPLWTGKQLLSSVLDIVRGDKPGLYLETRSKTKANIVGQEEAEVLIRGGQLLRGTLDKSSLGATIYGAVHGVQEVYGTEASDNFLSCLGRLCTFFLREHGHTTGIDDLLLQSDAEQERHSLISNALDGISISCTNAVYEALGTDASGDVSERLATTVHDARSLTEEMVSLYGIEAEDRLDTAMKAALNEVSSNVMNVCLPGKLQKRFPENGFSLMTSTGAKGSAVNSAQISCLVGSTVLEGRRVPRMGGSGATLPCFPPYDPSPNAGGYIAGRFLTGMAPFEFYFHAMAGREGLLDTSLKTANSGYLQRCLVKHLEGIKLHYDYTVRDSNGNVIQFLYGDDGIDPTKASWLMTKIDWQVKNIHCLRRKISARDPAVTALLHSRKKDKEQGIDVGSSRYPSVLEKLSPGVFSKNGAVSEKFRDEMELYVAKNGCDEDIISFLESRYQDAVAEPGEPVGIIAAQGVGEPSTQMTLNTFHHAGSSSAHVTLGIPRLRELIMTAAKYPKTPSMTIPILPEAGMKGAKKLAQRLSFVCLADLLLSIEVQDKHMCFLEDMGGMAVSIVGLVLRFPEPKLYEEELGVTFKKLSDSVNDEFMDVFNELLRKDVMRSERLVGPGSGLGKVKRLIPRVLGRDDLATEENVVLDSDRDEDSVNGENESSGKSKKGKRGKKKTSKSVSKSAGLSDEDASGGDSASDSNMSDNESDSEFSDEPEGEELDSQEEADEAVDIDEDVERLKREERELAGYDKKVINEIGPLGEAEASEDGTSIEITWIVPLSLTGRVDVAEVAREAAKKIKLVHVEGITKCFTEATSDGPVLVTEGSNLEQVFILGHGAVDYNRVLTNNMLGILKTYGVEALRLALIQEFRKVFDAYGIPVNIRHLNLIADYMTVNGTYRGFNRRSIDDAPSPFQKMTFETSVKFLSEAALYGTKDSVRNPSAAIAVGATYSGGTGGIDLLQPLT